MMQSGAEQMGRGEQEEVNIEVYRDAFFMTVPQFVQQIWIPRESDPVLYLEKYLQGYSETFVSHFMCWGG